MHHLIATKVHLYEAKETHHSKFTNSTFYSQYTSLGHHPFSSQTGLVHHKGHYQVLFYYFPKNLKFTTLIQLTLDYPKDTIYVSEARNFHQSMVSRAQTTQDTNYDLQDNLALQKHQNIYFSKFPIVLWLKRPYHRANHQHHHHHQVQHDE